MLKKYINFFGSIIILICILNLTSCAKKYTVSFYVDDQIIEEIEVKKRKTITPINDPNKENHIFIGWYNKDELFSFNTKITSNISLDAHFEHICEKEGHIWIDATTESPKKCTTCGDTEGEKIPTVSSIEIIGAANLLVDESINLKAICYPEGSSQDVTWSINTSGGSSATITNDGILTGIKEGKVYVTVRSNQNSAVYKTITLRVLHHLLETNVYDVFNIMTCFGTNASTDIEINYHTYNTETSVEYTLATDPEFNNLTEVTGYAYYFEDSSETLESIFVPRNIVRVSITNLNPNTEYIYRINKGDNTYSEIYSFKTSPNDGSDSSFLVLSDIHYHVSYDESNNPTSTGAESSEKLISKALEINPNIGFIATAGDTIDRGGSSNTWDIFFNLSTSLKTLPRIGVVGNHEFYINNTSTAQLDNRYHIINHATPLNGPKAQLGSSGYFVYNDILFLAIDNEDGTGRSELLEWIDYTLTNVEARYTIAIMHRPIFYEGNNIDRDEKMMAIFEKHCVDLVLSGHYHSDDYVANYYEGSISTDAYLGVNYLSLHSAGNKGATEANPASAYLIETKDGNIIIKRFDEEGNIKSTRTINTKKEQPVIEETKDNLINSIEGIYNETDRSYTISFSNKFYGNVKKIEITENLRNEISKVMLFPTPSYTSVTISELKDLYDYEFNLSITFSDGTKKDVILELIQSETSSFTAQTITDSSITLYFVPDNDIKYSIYTYSIIVDNNDPINFDSLDDYFNDINYYTIDNLESNKTYTITLLALNYKGKAIYTKTITITTKEQK